MRPKTYSAGTMGKTYKDRKKFHAYEVISVPEGTSICVVGDVHEHPEQYYKILEQWKPATSRWLVSLGDIYDKGFGVSAAETVTDNLKDLQKDGICWAVRGNHELKALKKFRKKTLSPQLEWWKQQPLVISFDFSRGRRVTVLHAGVTPNMRAQDLGPDIEVVYVRDVDAAGKMIPLVWKVENGEKILVKSRPGGKSWHELYDGRFGYIISGHAGQHDGEPKYYNFSCNIDTAVYDTGILTAQIIDQNGNLGEKLTANGVARNPELNIRY